MLYHCLADFLEELGRAGELLHVAAEVDPHLELAAVAARVAGAGGPALLFGRVRGHTLPVLANLFGNQRRIALALGGATPTEIAQRIAALMAPAEPDGWLQRLKGPSHQAGMATCVPRKVRTAPCQQIIRPGRDVDLGSLPFVQIAEGESGSGTTAGIVVCAGPDAAGQVASRLSLQRLSADRLAIGWAPHDEHARRLGEYRRLGQRMPVAVVLGGDPALMLAASARLPLGVDALTMAGLLRGKSLDVVACRSHELLVPGEAEIVLEGFVDGGEAAQPGIAIASPMGRVGYPRPMPVLHVTAVTHRANPIFPTMVYHGVKHEATLVEHALAKAFLPFWKSAVPGLVAAEMPIFGGARQCAVLAIRKTYAGQARQAACAAWGLSPWMFAKLLVIVDAEVDVEDPTQVLAAVCGNIDPGRDVFIEQGPPDFEDAATPPGTLGCRLGIDATAKLPGEAAVGLPPLAEASAAVWKMVAERWTEYGLGMIE